LLKTRSIKPLANRPSGPLSLVHIHLSLSVVKMSRC